MGTDQWQQRLPAAIRLRGALLWKRAEIPGEQRRSQCQWLRLQHGSALAPVHRARIWEQPSYGAGNKYVPDLRGAGAIGQSGGRMARVGAENAAGDGGCPGIRARRRPRNKPLARLAVESSLWLRAHPSSSKVLLLRTPRRLLT